MYYSFRLIGVAAVLSMVLLACGDPVGVVVDAEPGSADIEIDAPGAEVEISADDGETVVSIVTPEGEGLITAGESVPDGFPLPIAPGCKVVSSTTVDTPDGAAMSVVIEMPAAIAESVAAFYEQEFEKMGLQVTQTVTSNDAGGSIMLFAADTDGDGGASMFLQTTGDTATATIAVGGS